MSASASGKPVQSAAVCHAGERLGNFTGTKLYDSKSGEPSDERYPVEDALRKV
jgi:hypothetical protein